MKRIEPIKKVEVKNSLYDLYKPLEGLQLKVRQKVTEECDYSIPTYYRKVRGYPLSNAEKDKIFAVVLECLEDLVKFSAEIKREARSGPGISGPSTKEV